MILVAHLLFGLLPSTSRRFPIQRLTFLTTSADHLLEEYELGRRERGKVLCREGSVGTDKRHIGVAARESERHSEKAR